MINRIVILLLVLAFGFGAGYEFKARGVLADQAEQSQKVIKETAGGIVESVGISQEVQAKVDQDAAQIDQIKQQVAKRPVVKAQPEKPNGHAPDSKPDTPGQASDSLPARSRDVLDACTVRLLNAARQGRSAESTGCLDGQGQAAAAAAGR
jgi:hypothetical protein